MDTDSIEILEYDSPKKKQSKMVHYFPPSPEIGEFESPKSKSKDSLTFQFVQNSIEIEEFESPEKDERDVIHQYNESEANTDHWGLIGEKTLKRKNLGQQMKTILIQHESAVRMFHRDYRLGKFDEDQSITLVVRSMDVLDNKEKLTVAICRDVMAGFDRYVLFKGLHRGELSVGSILKLYQPWKDIDIVGLDLPVIISADFYRVARNKERFGVSKEFVTQLESLPLPKRVSFLRVFQSDELSSLLRNLVPYHISNQNTVRRQANMFREFMNLDAIIDWSWTTKYGSTLILLRDSDAFYSILEVSNTLQEEFCQIIKPGQYIKLTDVGIISKITILQDTLLFSVLRELGSAQTFYYKFSLLHRTKWERELELEIPFMSVKPCNKKFIHEIQDLGHCQDQRVSIECKIEKRSTASITIRDEFEDVMVIDITRVCYETIDSLLISGQSILIDFLRIGPEIPVMDEYSIVREIISNDELFMSDDGMPFSTE